MELNNNLGVASNGRDDFPIGSFSNKNSVTNKNGITDFQKVFNDSKTKILDELAESTQATKNTSDLAPETEDITVVDEPVVEEKEWGTDLSEEEQEKIKKAVNLLLTFMENHFPEQKIEAEELPAEEQKVLSALEQVAQEGETEQLVQVFSKKLEITTEMAQKLLANLSNLVANSESSAISEEKLAAVIAQGITPENLLTASNKEIVSGVSPEHLLAANNTEIVSDEFSSQLTSEENIAISVEQSVITNVANPNGTSHKVDLQTAIKDNIVASSIETDNVNQTKNLMAKPVISEEPISVATAPQIEKLSSAQMPALQSHANFIVGKINSDSMAKNNSKTVDKVENTLSTTVSSQPIVSMMSLQTKLGQQFSDLENSHKNNLEQSIKPLQESNQVKSTYADLLMPNNKNAELENVELNLLQDRAALSRQIVDNIKIMQKNNNTAMVIRLKPEHMGEMILRISTNAAGTISASFQTNNPEARMALESTMLVLKQELAANGLKVQDVDLFGGISDFLSGQSQANKDQKSNHSNKSFAEQKEEKVENIMDKLSEQAFNDDGNVDYRI